MTIEIIYTKVWDGAGINLATPGSAIRHASVARHVTDCAKAIAGKTAAPSIKKEGKRGEKKREKEEKERVKEKKERKEEKKEKKKRKKKGGKRKKKGGGDKKRGKREGKKGEKRK